ncbi:hypothetical protein B0H16DRAFT_1717910 [Mycena metata]|uniref:Uncharacterized protein n=1 Tax=Mycena metata TaxID=1033252 RepID=A0AAD7JIU0_9AGAR|nr:hypothetical protein B0H16DRAFT_1717910 [Mycena metata]
MSSSPDSSFERLRISYSSSTNNEICLARENVANAKEELEKLKARIPAMLEKYIAEQERIIFSINRLPTELLSLIFLHRNHSILDLYRRLVSGSGRANGGKDRDQPAFIS